MEVAEEGSEELFADEEQYIDLAKELEAELAAEEAMVEEATGSGKGEAVLEEVFREFQKGVAEQLSEEDSDTHFNLGIAYREMGLLPEAIREFQVAARDAEFFVESCSVIGVCYQEQGMWPEATEWYQKALVAPNITDDARLALRYDLAGAYESAGDGVQALGNLRGDHGCRPLLSRRLGKAAKPQPREPGELKRLRISNFEFRIFGNASGNGSRSPEVPGIPIRRESACLASSREALSGNGPHGIR